MPADEIAEPAKEGSGGPELHTCSYGSKDFIITETSLAVELKKMPVDIVVPPVLLTGTENVDEQHRRIPTTTTVRAAVKDVETAIPILLAGVPVTTMAVVAEEGDLDSLFPTEIVALLPVVFTEPI